MAGCFQEYFAPVSSHKKPKAAFKKIYSAG